MKKIAIFFAEGYEEIEALTVADLTKRAGIETWLVSVTEEKCVTSSHGVKVLMDKTLSELKAIAKEKGIKGYTKMSKEELKSSRYEKFRKMGAFLE